MKSGPLVSVIMPAYNAGPWIADAMRSVLDQSIDDLELIVIDDGSTDDTRARVQSNSDARVLLLQGQHRGAAAARNLGLDKARGHYIQHLDADDLLAPDKLEAQLDVLQQHDHDVASGSWIRFHGARPRSEQGVRDVLWQDCEPLYWLQRVLARECMTHPGAWLVPRGVLERAGRWNENLSLNDDGEFFARVVAHSHRVRFVESARSWYRSSIPGSLSGRPHWGSAVAALDGMTRTLLSLDAGSASREAAAAAWARLAVQLYACDRDLSVGAWAQARELDPEVQAQISGGTRIQQLSRWIGWRAARWLQYRLRGR